jgi:hypothetical protein
MMELLAVPALPIDLSLSVPRAEEALAFFLSEKGICMFGVCCVETLPCSFRPSCLFFFFALLSAVEGAVEVVVDCLCRPDLVRQYGLVHVIDFVSNDPGTSALFARLRNRFQSGHTEASLYVACRILYDAHCCLLLTLHYFVFCAFIVCAK